LDRPVWPALVREAEMRKPLSLLAVLVTTLGLAVTLSTGVGSPANAAARSNMKAPFSREVVRYGDVDSDPYHIHHVYEVQYRLKWLGLLKATPNGHFGRLTQTAVRLFQTRNGLRPTGVVNYPTWKRLIPQTIRARKEVPGICKKVGWHVCYDRRHHQLNLYHKGVLLNSWLVRGGEHSAQTRIGNFTVYYRDIDHYSTQYDGSPMPYSQFFSGGEALHGSRYMVDPFVDHSHGCVNMWVKDARQLWDLTSTTTLRVHVYGAWD
jgi:hypothetical protein